MIEIEIEGRESGVGKVEGAKLRDASVSVRTYRESAGRECGGAEEERGESAPAPETSEA